MMRRERLKRYLMDQWMIEEKVAKSFARKHANYQYEKVVKSVNSIVVYFKNLHISHYGYSINEHVLYRALNHGLRRFARSCKPLSDKQLSYLLQLAKDEVASQMTSCHDPGTKEEREMILHPLKQALVYENDEAMRKRLLYIYALFVNQGMRLAKNKVINACTSDENLFPHRRVVEDALETLRGAYEALGFLEGELFITPEYISTN
ncbi:hypothetical protein GF373_16975 [bacterium]|nr:hypothetical protein [bacterium]